MRSFLRGLWDFFWALIAIATVLSVVAFFYDFRTSRLEVEPLAEQAACAAETKPCRAQMTRYERSLLVYTYEYTTPKRKIYVRCTRKYALVGEYACTIP